MTDLFSKVITNALIFLVITGCDFSKNNDDAEALVHKGLVGAWYHSSDLTRIGSSMWLGKPDVHWDVISGRGNSWSAQWEGYITVPVSGKVNFYAESDRQIIVEIDGAQALHIGGSDDNKEKCTLTMTKDQNYPIRIIYMQHKEGTPFFRVLWSWENHEKQVIPANVLGFTQKQADWWNYRKKPDPSAFDFSKLNIIPAQHHIVYGASGRYAGWPANNGIWSWGNEILVGYNLGYHDPDVSGGHAIRSDMPDSVVLSRSLDGGETWNLEKDANFSGTSVISPGFDFSDPDFAMRIRNDSYFASTDRGKSWQGPFIIKILTKGGNEITALTSRTDYLITGPSECLVFFSVETGLVEADYQDRSFCAVTKDGGKTFHFLGWMTENTDTRSVMSSTVSIAGDHLVSVMRRKHEQRYDDKPAFVSNWIEAAESRDSGVTWNALGKIAETDQGERNGNPPALVKLKDKRLCVAYGYRGYPYGIHMKTSSDNGRTWSNEYVIRHDGATWDVGYPRITINDKGYLVLVYYFTTKEHYEQYIAVSIIDPAELNVD